MIRLTGLIGRTAGSVAYKLVNFASLDPSLQARGIRGALNAGRLDKAIWDEFFTRLDTLPFESETLLARYEQTTVEALNHIHLSEVALLKAGKTREQIVKARVNQSFFRSSVLAAYSGACCVTGLRQTVLLIAGHIQPWSRDEQNRMNPRNGIAINALHDKAFETGLMTITPDYQIRISSLLLKQHQSPGMEELFCKYEGSPIFLPSGFLPDPAFLEYHNRERFKP